MKFKKYIIKYSFEFVVIVIGISFSFWIDEWNMNRTNKVQHLEDLRRRREEEDEEDDDEEESLKIGDNVQLEISDVNDLSKSLKLESLPVLDDIEILEPI